MTSEKHPHYLLATDLTCITVATTVVFSVLYEVLSALEQVTMSLSVNYIIGTTTEYVCFYIDFFLFSVIVSSCRSCQWVQYFDT